MRTVPFCIDGKYSRAISCLLTLARTTNHLRIAAKCSIKGCGGAPVVDIRAG